MVHTLVSAHNELLLSKDKSEVFSQIPMNKRGFVLLQLPRYIQKKLLKDLSDDEILSIIGFLDPNEVTDVFQAIDKHRRDRLVEQLTAHVREKVEFLLPFDSQTAAGLMSLDYVCVDYQSSFEDVARSTSLHVEKTGKFPIILAVDDGLLKGELLGNTFIGGRKRDKISSHLRSTPTIHYNSGKESVLKMFKNHPHDKIIVLDDDESIIGIIFSDDLLRTLDEKNSKSLSHFAGVQEENVDESIASKVSHRYNWLIINLATAFLASLVVSLFQDTIEAFVLLAVYMPIVAGMGGNAGTQTLAVVVRGLALGQIDIKTGRKAVLKEMVAGLINGVIIGLIVTVIAFILNKNLLLGVIAGVSMIITLAIAGFFGSVIPLIMKHFGKDPATSAAIFITTATDLSGFFTFLGLASLLL